MSGWVEAPKSFNKNQNCHANCLVSFDTGDRQRVQKFPGDIVTMRHEFSFRKTEKKRSNTYWLYLEQGPGRIHWVHVALSQKNSARNAFFVPPILGMQTFSLPRSVTHYDLSLWCRLSCAQFWQGAPWDSFSWRIWHAPAPSGRYWD